MGGGLLPGDKKVAFTFWAARMILSAGGVVMLMVQVRVAGVASTLPAASVARTEKVWEPLARVRSTAGLSVALLFPVL
jgi:hypothetical protein